MTKIALLVSVSLFILFVAATIIYYPTNPLETVRCFIVGGKLERVGIAGRHCKMDYSDASKACFSDKDCMSGKCVIGIGGQLYPQAEGKVRTIKSSNPISLNKSVLIDDSVMGNCSQDNIHPCFSGEATIKDDRTINYPPICD